MREDMRVLSPTTYPSYIILYFHYLQRRGIRDYSMKHERDRAREESWRGRHSERYFILWGAGGEGWGGGRHNFPALKVPSQCMFFLLVKRCIGGRKKRLENEEGKALGSEFCCE
jgi:hypothetical protein